MNTDDMRMNAALPTTLSVPERVNAFLTAVYGWMCAGHAVTAGTAWFIAQSPAIVNAIAANRLLFWALIIAQLGIVFVLSARVLFLLTRPLSTLFLFLFRAAFVFFRMELVRASQRGEPSRQRRGCGGRIEVGHRRGLRLARRSRLAARDIADMARHAPECLPRGIVRAWASPRRERERPCRSAGMGRSLLAAPNPDLIHRSSGDV